MRFELKAVAILRELYVLREILSPPFGILFIVSAHVSFHFRPYRRRDHIKSVCF